MQEWLATACQYSAPTAGAGASRDLYRLSVEYCWLTRVAAAIAAPIAVPVLTAYPPAVVRADLTQAADAIQQKAGTDLAADAAAVFGGRGICPKAPQGFGVDR